MTLDVRRLRVLREVARQGSLAAAARALHLTPPAVSQQLAALEREADVRLLHRDGRKVTLTEAAHTLVAHTDTILAQLEAAAADIAAMEGRYGGSLHIGAFPTAAATFVATAMARVASHLPMVRVRIEELEPEDGLARLKAADLDVVIAHEYDRVPRRPDPALHRVALRTEALYIALPPDHALAAASSVNLADLADERWIAPPDGLTCLDELRRVCAAAGFEPDLGSHAYTHPLVFALVAGGLGVALVPELALPCNVANAVVKPLHRPAANRHVFAAVRNGTAHRPSIDATLSALRTEAGCSPARGKTGRVGPKTTQQTAGPSAARWAM